MRKWTLLLLIAAAVPGVLFAEEASAVRLLVGRSTIVDVGSAIARVSLTSADVADALVTSSNQLLVNGKMPGTISMFVWERSGALRRYEVVVQRDLAHLNEQMKQLFPGENIDAQSNGKSIVLSGIVSAKDVSDKAVNVAAGYVDKPDEVVSLLRLQETAASNQVLLRVRFAEVSRSAMSELGASLFTSPTGVNNVLGRVTTQQFSAPGFDQLTTTKASGDFNSAVTSASGQFTFSDFLNLFLFSEKLDLGVMVRALQTKGMFQSLAEPNLVAESGKEASFLAGGEFPVPIAQGSGGNLAISVQYKEFGVRLSFTPTVTGSRIHLKVRPEVSTLDFANGVLLQGFRIPALSTRRTETELELVDGQTFAIAGLMNNTVNSTLQKIPGIGDIPILGALFKSKAAQKNQTELVVMITPQILPRNSPGVTTSLPRTPEPYLPPVPSNKLVEPPAPAFTPARSSADGSAASAAAIVQALASPATRSVVVPAAPAAPAATPAPAGERPLTSDQRRALERAQKQEAAARAADAKARVKQAEADRRQQKAAAEQQARRDAAAAAAFGEQVKQQAKRDAKAEKKAAKAAAEQATRQAELERKQQ